MEKKRKFGLGIDEIDESDRESHDPRLTDARDPDPRDNPTDGKNPRFGENSPDEILEDARPRGDEYPSQILREPAGENLEEQSPTQDQPSGEDDVGGFSDEEYDEDPEGHEDDR